MQNKIAKLEESLKKGYRLYLIEINKIEKMKNSEILNSKCNISELNGHYEISEYKPPEWLRKLNEKSKKGYCILIIDNIDKISKEEQNKFLEIIRYKKISVFELPKNCIVLMTCSKISKELINKEVYLSTIHI